MSIFLKRYQVGLRWLPALFFAILIFISSATPGDEIDQYHYELQAAVQTISHTVTLAIHAISATHATSAVHVASAAPAIPVAHATSAAPAISTTHSPSVIALVLPDLDWLKVGHVIGYFCLGFSVLYALPSRSRWSPSIALMMCCAYAFTDEFHQIFTPGRDPLPRDILLDSLAALLGVAIGLGFMAFKEFFKQQ
jgi:VanZ family protein